jgi:hypothetical protein
MRSSDQRAQRRDHHISRRTQATPHRAAEPAIRGRLPSPGIQEMEKVDVVEVIWGDPDSNGAHGFNERVEARAVYVGGDYLFDLVKAHAD